MNPSQMNILIAMGVLVIIAILIIGKGQKKPQKLSP